MPRYSLSGLMLFTLGIAGGIAAASTVIENYLSIFGIDPSTPLLANRISAGVTCALVFWIASGLACQVWDIHRFLRQNPTQTVALQSSLQFEILWRSTIAIVLPATYIMQKVGKSWEATGEELSPLRILTNPGHYNDLRWLLMILAIGASRGLRPRPPTTALTSSLNLLGYLIGLLLAAVLIFDSGLISMLVRIAINGVEQAEPIWAARFPSGIELARSEWRFFTVSQLQILCAVGAVVLAALWSRKRQRSVSAKYPMILSVALAMASLACEVWIYREGLPTISPAMAETRPCFPQLAKLLIGALGLSYLAAKTSLSRDEVYPAAWRSNTTAYLHERPLILAVAALVDGIQLAAELIEFNSIPNLFSSKTWLSNIFGILQTPGTFWPLAMLIVTVQQFLLVRKQTSAELNTYGFSWKTFAVSWLFYSLVALTVDCAIKTWAIAIWIPFG